MDARRARRARATGALAAATVAALLLSAPGAVADPTSDDDVRRAHEAVGRAQQSVAELEIRLAQLSAETDAAQIAVQQAGEAYARAMVEAQDAQTAADAAADRSDAAAADAEQARRELVAIARQVARSGGSADLVEALLSADGFQDVARRTSQMDRFTRKTDEVVQAYQAARLVAGTLAEGAAQAASTATAAQDQAQILLDVAQRAADEAETAQASAETERSALLAQLAAARQTSVEVERARQDQIDAERRRREDDAARLEREKAAQQQVTPPPAPPAPPAQSPGDAPSHAPTQRPSQPPTSEPTQPPTPTRPPSQAPVPPTSTPTPPPSTTPTAPASPTSPPAPSAPTTPPAPPAPAADRYGLGTGVSRGSAALGANAVAAAKTRLGAPYVWAGVGPGYDCSGLTMTAWRTAGVSLYRTSRDQYKQVLKVAYADMRPGDLVFWGTDPKNPDSIYHVAMYIGGGQIIEAPRPGLTVRITAMRYAGSMPYAGRP